MLVPTLPLGFWALPMTEGLTECRLHGQLVHCVHGSPLNIAV